MVGFHLSDRAITWKLCALYLVLMRSSYHLLHWCRNCISDTFARQLGAQSLYHVEYYNSY